MCGKRAVGEEPGMMLIRDSETLLTSLGQEQSEMGVHTEPVDIEGNAERQCLHLLGGGRATSGPR